LQFDHFQDGSLGYCDYTTVTLVGYSVYRSDGSFDLVNTQAYASGEMQAEGDPGYITCTRQ